MARWQAIKCKQYDLARSITPCRAASRDRDERLDAQKGD